MIKVKSELFENIDEKLLIKFKKYHLENPQVYKRFSELAHKMKSTGRKKYSQWVIINKMRWDSDIKTKGDIFKISNDFIALYARLLVYHCPEFSDFFELKKMKKIRKNYSNEAIEKHRANSQIKLSIVK